jgi:hypothetical protein
MVIARRQQGMKTQHSDDDGTTSIAESRLKAFDLAGEWAKHITTLAIGTLVLSATFIKDVLPEGKPVDSSWLIFVAWALLGATSILGVLVQSALVAQLSRTRSEPDIYDGTVRLFSALQFLLFFAGIGFFAAFAGINL